MRDEFPEMPKFVCTGCKQTKLAMHFYFRKGKHARRCRKCVAEQEKQRAIKGGRSPFEFNRWDGEQRGIKKI